MKRVVTHSLALPVVLGSLACAASAPGTPAASAAGTGGPVVVRASFQPDGDTRLLEDPALHGEHVAFVYAGDLWLSRTDGAELRRLTTHSGHESRPRFSPDGSMLAFSAQYDGNTDVYVVDAEGGIPRRLTWHPSADWVQGFTPDGSGVLFASQRTVHTRRFHQLFTVSLAGGQPESLPIPNAFKASYSPDGSKIAYVPVREVYRQWKNYRGGTTGRIWIYDVADHSVEEIAQPEGRCNDTDPMWIGDDVYFSSDRGGEFNLHVRAANGAVRQVTGHEDFPVLAASTDGRRIVYEQAGWLHVLDAASGEARRLSIDVPADLIETRPRFVKGKQHVRSAALSPSGKRAVFGFRGEVVTVPAEKGNPRNLTRSPGTHESSPAWSPDGRWIAYFSDAGGEYGLHVAPSSGRGEKRTFDLEGAGFYADLAWSPDSKWLSYSDNSLSLFLTNAESGETRKIGQEPLYGPLDKLEHSWSPDSSWIAYTLANEMYFRRVHLYDVESGSSHVITDGMSDVSSPVFDAGGKYLYFAASTDAGPANTWFAQSGADIEQSNALYLAVLSADEPSPFAPESDEEEVAEEEEGEEESEDEGDEDEGDEDEADEEEDGEEPIRIDLEGIDQRIVALPLEPAHYANLRTGEEGKLLYLKSDEADVFGAPTGKLTMYDVGEREEKSLLDEADGFTVSADRKKVLIAADDAWTIADAGKPVEGGKGKLAVDSIEVKIDPAVEWPQIFDEAWRINRDYFYDPDMHGADWPAMREKYAPFLDHLATRRDLNRVVQWMCSELAVGHHRVGGGESFGRPKPVSGGLLGADYEVTDGRYRFAKVYGGLNWTPDLRAPLTQPGVNVRAGEYLLAVEGEDLRAPENLYSRFENTSGKTIELTVGPNADGSDSRTVQVVPLSNETALRNRDWVEANVRYVTERTDGRVAYVHVPNTAGLGHTYFKRYFFPQADREAIIVDERYNGGGLIADYYIDILRRPYISHWAMRYGRDLETPQGAIQGPKVMIIDENAGSGGDLLPWMFRKLGLGKLVGKRTWGGLVGTLGFPGLMDGGSVSAPNLGFWTEEGFRVENEGVPPDIEVEQLPVEVIAGRDPQLDKAIEVVLEELEKNPPKAYVRPPFPVRARK
jgi:tricorn protease